jgi:hypothetical protein
MSAEAISLTKLLNAVAERVPKPFRADPMIPHKDGDIGDQLEFKERQVKAAAILYKTMAEAESRITMFDSRKVGLPIQDAAAHDEGLKVLLSAQAHLAEAKEQFLSLAFARRLPSWWWKPPFTEVADQLSFERLSLLSWLDVHGIAYDESQLMPELTSLNIIPGPTTLQGEDLKGMPVETPTELEFDARGVADWMENNGVHSVRTAQGADGEVAGNDARIVSKVTPKNPNYDDVRLEGYIKRNERGEPWEKIADELGVSRQAVEKRIKKYRARQKKSDNPFSVKHLLK